MRQNNEEYELGTVEVIVNKVEKTLTKVIFSDYLGTIEYTLTYGEGGQIEKIGYTVEAEGETQEMIYNGKVNRFLSLMKKKPKHSLMS